MKFLEFNVIFFFVDFLGMVIYEVLIFMLRIFLVIMYIGFSFFNIVKYFRYYI